LLRFGFGVFIVPRQVGSHIGLALDAKSRFSSTTNRAEDALQQECANPCTLPGLPAWLLWKPSFCVIKNLGAGHACDSDVSGGAVFADLVCGRMHGILVQA